MIIPDLSLVTIILGEILRPLYMFLIFSVSYWFFNQKYYYFAACLFFISLVGLVINIVQIKKLNKKIHDMAFHQVTLNVLQMCVKICLKINHKHKSIFRLGARN